MQSGLARSRDAPLRDRSLVALDGRTVRGAAANRLYTSLYRWMAFTDCLCVVAGLLIAYQFRFGELWPSDDFWLVLAVAPFVTLAFGVGFGLYRTHQYSSLEEFRRIVLSLSMTITAIVMLSFWSKASFSRLWIGYSWVLALVLAAASRRLWHREIRRGWSAGELTFDTLIVGTNSEAEHLADLLTASKLGYRPLGFVATSAQPPSGTSLPVLGPIGELRDLIHQTGANCVFVAATAVEANDVKHVLKARRLDGIEVRVTANVPAMLATTRVTPRSVGGLMTLSIHAVRLTRAQAIAKRTFDLVVSSIALLLLSPVLLAVAVAVKLDGGGPVLFRQARVGLHRQPFTLLKFRTMVPQAELQLPELVSRNEADGPLFKLRDDPRITRVGRVLRRYSVDELPQLLNVLRGEMSLVGPRPPLPSEVARYEDWQLDRLEVRPGITGLWQVSGRSELSFEEYVRLDLFYIENWSMLYDLFVVAKTVPILFMPRGAY
ncbi:MAG TPA: sugar transferase [Actinomycetes bacterium]|nr:sugar transferase [Actinomycetes bacterium]